jgi:hypothetical protein
VLTASGIPSRTNMSTCRVEQKESDLKVKSAKKIDAKNMKVEMADFILFMHPSDIGQVKSQCL